MVKQEESHDRDCADQACPVIAVLEMGQGASPHDRSVANDLKKLTECQFHLTPEFNFDSDKKGAHRQRTARKLWPGCAMVARPIGKRDLRQFSAKKLDEAQAARIKEWDNLRGKSVWLDQDVVEWADVVRESRQEGETIHLGHLHGLMVEKNSELPDDDVNKKLKYRVVFLGDRVRTQNWEAAMFMDQGSAPATMEAAKICDAYGLFPGNDLIQADAEQA